MSTVTKGYEPIARSNCRAAHLNLVATVVAWRQLGIDFGKTTLRYIAGAAFIGPNDIPLPRGISQRAVDGYGLVAPDDDVVGEHQVIRAEPISPAAHSHIRRLLTSVL